MIKEKLKYQDKDKITKVILKEYKRRSLLSGTLIAIVIILSPYLFYVYQGIPDSDVWDSPFGLITSNYYGSVQVLFWTIFNKVVPFILLLIWFFTCKHWWYHAILVPLCMLIFQMYTVVNDEVVFADSNEFFILAPIIFLMLIFSYTIRTRVFDKIHGIDLSELSRVNWKGELKKENTSEKDDDSDDDDDELFMSY